jgi:hypothetical protein
VEIVSPPPHKYLHQKTHKFTLKSTKVEVVEMVEILSIYLPKMYYVFQLTIAYVSVCVRFNELSSMHHDDAAEKAICLLREHKGESQKLSAHSPSSSSLIAPRPSSVMHSSLSQGPTTLPVSSAAAHPLSVEVTSVANKSKRPSKIELATTLRKRFN